MQYSDKVMDHFQHPRNVGRLVKNDPNVGTGTRGAPACGDVLSLQIKVNDNGVIEDAKFKTYGCTSAIASSSLVTELIKGKTLEEAEQLKIRQLPKNLSFLPSKSTVPFLRKTPSRPQWKTIARNRLRLRINNVGYIDRKSSFSR